MSAERTEIIHTVPDCGGVAFCYDHYPQEHEMIMAQYASHPDGTRAREGDQIICAACSRLCQFEDLQPVAGGTFPARCF